MYIYIYIYTYIIYIYIYYSIYIISNYSYVFSSSYAAHPKLLKNLLQISLGLLFFNCKNRRFFTGGIISNIISNSNFHLVIFPVK